MSKYAKEEVAKAITQDRLAKEYAGIFQYPSRECLKEKLKGIKLVAFDFDGVFTDNHVYSSEDGFSEFVRCWRGDGIGIGILKRLDIKTLIVSSETSPVVKTRASKMGVDICETGVYNKLRVLEEFLDVYAFTRDQLMFVGNDINDLSAMTVAGISIAVADAHWSVKEAADWITKAKGGKGAVREVCEMIEEVHLE